MRLASYWARWPGSAWMKALGDLPANILGQHRVQPDMGIAGQVGVVGVLLHPAVARYGPGPRRPRGRDDGCPCQQGDATGLPPPPPGLGSPGAQQLGRPGFQAGADIDEHPGLGGPGHHRRGRFKGVGAGARRDQHLDLDQVAADLSGKSRPGAQWWRPPGACRRGARPRPGRSGAPAPQPARQAHRIKPRSRNRF